MNLLILSCKKQTKKGDRPFSDGRFFWFHIAMRKLFSHTRATDLLSRLSKKMTG